MLKVPPSLDVGKDKVDKWKRLEPLDIKMLIKKEILNLTEEKVTTKTEGDWSYTGQVINGIVREVNKGGRIYEGQHTCGAWNGYGRLIWYAGYYEGYFRDGKKEGQGREVTNDGKKLEGLFKEGKFIKN